MAIGDYIKSLLNNGYGPPFRNAAYHNKQENKIYDLDQATAALQTATAAVADALNAGTYNAANATTADDADKVSAFGIGTKDATALNGVSLNTIIVGGNFSFINCTDTPAELGADGGYLEVHANSTSGYVRQVVKYEVGNSDNIRTLERSCYAGIWGNWKHVWNSSSDGNGGRPPAPKPLQTDTSLAGYENVASVPAGNNFTLPSGGTWLWKVMAPYGAFISTAYSSTSPGGTLLTNASVNLQIHYKRISA